MRYRSLIAALLIAALPSASGADEQGFTNRSTELKERGAADSATVATLPENTAVKVLARGGGWTRVEAGGRSGWVRVFHLRFPSAVESSSSSGVGLASLGSALGLGGGKNRDANIATTGIRGLSPEDLKNANPDPEALRRLQGFRADRPGAERFAREAKLAAVQVEVPDAAKEDSR